MADCPHGDPTCPCQDFGRLEVDGRVNSDPCHYEGFDPMRCPNPPPGARLLPGFEVHCHVEGCGWGCDPEAPCGLEKLLGGPNRYAWVDAPDLVLPPPDSIEWACGASRAACVIIANLGW